MMKKYGTTSIVFWSAIRVFEPSQVKTKTLKLVFAASPLSTQCQKSKSKA